MSYISQISVDGGSPLPIASRLYGTCSTLANVSAKVVLCPDFDQLINGVTIRIEFTYSNTAANATLNVNQTGTIPIYQHGTTPVGSDEGSSWKPGSVVAFTYNGSAWMMNGSASPTLSPVATSGSYNDLADKPVLSNVATSGSYNDLTDKPSIPTATSQLTNDSHFATESFVNQAFAANDAMVLKGTLGASGTVASLPAVHEVGWTYKVATAGTYAGQECEVGDMVICIADGTEASSLDWTVVQTNMQDCVTTDQGVANTGKLMQVDSNGHLVPVSLTVSNETLQLA